MPTDIDAESSSCRNTDNGIRKTNDVDDNGYDTDTSDSSDGSLKEVDGSQLFAMVHGDTGIRMDDLRDDLNYLIKTMRDHHVVVDTYEDLPWDEYKHNGRLCDACQDLHFDDSKHDPAPLMRYFPISVPRTVVFSGRSGKSRHFMSVAVPFARLDALPNIPDITISAEEGCSFCSLLRVALQRRGLLDQPSTETGIFISEAEYHWHTEEKTEKKHDKNVEDGSLNLFSVLVQVGDREPFKLWFKISAPRDLCAAWLSIRERPPLQFNGTEQRLSCWVAKHTKSCQECQKAPQRGQPPTRLIDVGTPSGNEEPRLIITNEHDVHKHCWKALPGYLILSYCWGGLSGHSSMTTTKNFPDYQKRMSMDIFPATCRDAIRVTRSLGFRYLWIDAFCIIQDDEEDWHREAGRMVDAYKNAFLTIVPLRSQSSHDGFLDSSPRGAIIPFESRVVRGLQGQFWMHEIQPDPKDQLQSPFEQRVSLSDATQEILLREEKASKWETRAWTFQEGLVCQKALIFGIESTYFKCGRAVYSADGEKPYNTVSLDGPGNYLELPEENQSKKDILGRFWYRLIHSFLKREITDQNDRLPAISSLARAINERLPEEDQYVAGLFSSDLPRGLMWQNESGSKAHGFDDHLEWSFFTRPSYISPSWSWASSHGKVAYSPLTWLNTRFEEVHCGIHADVEIRPENPYGKVENATLVVTSKAYNCNSVTIRHRPDDDDDELVLEDDEGFQAHLSMDWTIGLPENDTLRVSSSTPYDSKFGPLHNMHLIQLLVSDPAMARSSDGHQERLYGLIAVPNPDPESKDSWIRAGVFTSYEREGCQKAKAYFDALEEKTFKIV